MWLKFYCEFEVGISTVFLIRVVVVVNILNFVCLLFVGKELRKEIWGLRK